MSLRIVSGQSRGRSLEVPKGIRPTEGRVREALAAIWGERLDGARVLDLFAGSGAMGLEAISRGASWVTFVESGPKVLSALRRNAEELATNRYEILRRALPAGLRRAPEQGYDLLFADPPYGFGQHEEMLRRVASWARMGALLTVERSRRDPMPSPEAPWRQLDERVYGETALSLFELAGIGSEVGGEAAVESGTDSTVGTTLGT